jgi:hypothetical protein
MEPRAREGAMSTVIPIADIGQKYLVTLYGCVELDLSQRLPIRFRLPEILFNRRIRKCLKPFSGAEQLLPA